MKINMVKQLAYIALLFVSFTSCKENNESFTLNNLLKAEDIPVVIKRTELKTNTTHKFPVFYFLDEPIPSQLDDLDGDGTWDEVALSLSTLEKGDLTLTVKWQDRIPDFPIRTNIRMGISEAHNYNFKDISETTRPKGHVKEDPPRLYQMEGPAWENDNVAFRAYFDTRNGKDIFGKSVKEMVLDSVGLQTGNYHALANWGMDILKVGNSLGAGALAVMYNDSLYRLENTERETFKIIIEGPVRSIFEMNYKDWNVGDLNLNLTERITIWAGRNGYQSEITINGTEEPIQLVTGMVNYQSDSLYTKEIGNYSYWATHDKQSENNDILGMAIFTQSKNLINTFIAPKEGDGITNTYYGSLSYTVDKPITFWFVCGWEKTEKRYAGIDYFFKMLAKEIEIVNYEK